MPLWPPSNWIRSSMISFSKIPPLLIPGWRVPAESAAPAQPSFESGIMRTTSPSLKTWLPPKLISYSVSCNR